MSKEVKLEDIVSLCKRRGFIFQGSDIYGGLAGTWDYGPLGLALKKNIMDLWWQTFVDGRDDMYGVDAAILMNQKVWQASGHVDTFNDPMIECKNCKARFRTDKLVTDSDYKSSIVDMKVQLQKLTSSLDEKLDEIKELIKYAEKFPNQKFIEELNQRNENLRPQAIDADFMLNDLPLADNYLGKYPGSYLSFIEQKCDICGLVDWGESVPFNMMFETFVGPTASVGLMKAKAIVSELNDKVSYSNEEAFNSLRDAFKEYLSAEINSRSYLRPETAQGIFTNYKNVVDTFYPDVPFGIAQQGKAFRNEISPRDFVFRSREFEQMEIEYFVRESEWEAAFEQWRKDIETFLEALGLPKDKVEEVEVAEADRAHYSKRTIDYEYDFPHGKDELLGLAYRTSFDLDNIAKASGKGMEYRPKDGGEPFVPHVIEPSFGVERAVMAVLASAYWNDEANERIVLKLPYHLAPVKVAVCPLAKNNDALVAKAREVYDMLRQEFGQVLWIDSGNIGKNYRKMDEIGVPYVVTVDFDTLEGDTEDTVTVRHRDTTDQERVKIDDVISQLK